MSNVKAGDTAMLIEPSNYGRLVHVEAWDRSASAARCQLVWKCIALQTIRCGNESGDQVADWPPGTSVRTFDRNLRPIRDTDGTDEALVLAEKRDALPKALRIRQIVEAI